MFSFSCICYALRQVKRSFLKFLLKIQSTIAAKNKISNDEINNLVKYDDNVDFQS